MVFPIGGAALPCAVSTAAPQGGAALRVVRDDSADTTGGAALPVYVVSDAELAAGVFTLAGNEPLRIAVVSDERPVLGQPAPVPVYVIDG